MGGPRNAAYVWTIVVLAVLAFLATIPTPYYLLAPGSAVDLSTRISVDGHTSPTRRYLLTDVTLARASVLLLAGRLWPGTRIVRREAIVPPGISAKGYETIQNDAMSESQNVAALVAERAAGYRIAPAALRVVVEGFEPASPAAATLRRGDRFLRVEGRPIVVPADVSRAVARVARGARARVLVERDGARLRLDVPTYARAHGARLGVLVDDRVGIANLPVRVSYAIDDIAGSSGGLMFALQIYSELRGGDGGDAVAGTGTLAPDGRVGRIEGTQQKLIAAERAGASTFLVPLANYREIAGERGVRIVAVRTFADALAAIGARAHGARAAHSNAARSAAPERCGRRLRGARGRGRARGRDRVRPPARS